MRVGGSGCKMLYILYSIPSTHDVKIFFFLIF